MRAQQSSFDCAPRSLSALSVGACQVEQCALLLKGQHQPALAFLIPHVKVDVDDAPYGAKRLHGIARTPSFKQLLTGHNVDDPELVQGSGLGRLFMRRPPLRQYELMGRGRGPLRHALQGNHVGAGSLRLGIQNPSRAHMDEDRAPGAAR